MVRFRFAIMRRGFRWSIQLWSFGNEGNGRVRFEGVQLLVQFCRGLNLRDCTTIVIVIHKLEKSKASEP
jgi:hypothetical protein